ncbi:MAG: zinc ribbon domain-containing protein [Clostridia bacterium]
MEFLKKINEISKKVGEGATETYKTVADKSGKLFEEAKNKIAISDKQNDIEQIYCDMGKTVYDVYVKGEDVGKAFSKECKNIDKINDEVEEMKKNILFNKKLRKCQNCNEIIDIDSVYCINCGEKQKAVKIKKEKKEVEKEEETLVCPTCGTVAEKEAKFCAKCGYKF